MWERTSGNGCSRSPEHGRSGLICESSTVTWMKLLGRPREVRHAPYFITEEQTGNFGGACRRPRPRCGRPYGCIDTRSRFDPVGCRDWSMNGRPSSRPVVTLRISSRAQPALTPGKLNPQRSQTTTQTSILCCYSRV